MPGWNSTLNVQKFKLAQSEPTLQIVTSHGKRTLTFYRLTAESVS